MIKHIIFSLCRKFRKQIYITINKQYTFYNLININIQTTRCGKTFQKNIFIVFRIETRSVKQEVLSTPPRQPVSQRSDASRESTILVANGLNETKIVSTMCTRLFHREKTKIISKMPSTLAKRIRIVGGREVVEGVNTLQLPKRSKHHDGS